jgi:hypothetical protein
MMMTMTIMILESKVISLKSPFFCLEVFCSF